MKHAKIKDLINKAMDLQREGKNKKALELIQEAKREEKLHRSWPLMGEIHHCEGQILQGIGQRYEAIYRLSQAVQERKECPRGYGDSMFQLFTAKIDAKKEISPEEMKETKIALWEMADASTSPKVFGDALQNLAYIKLKEGNQGDIYRAILFYRGAERFRELDDDQRGLSLIWMRLGECYKKQAMNEKAKEYGKMALSFFEKEKDLKMIEQIEEWLLKIN